MTLLCRLQLSLWAVWNVSYSWITSEAALEGLSLLLLSQAGWLLPALLPFMHAHVGPQLSHTPDSHILHMKIIGSKLPFFVLSHLGPTTSSTSLPMCRSMAVLQSLPPGAWLPSTIPQVFGSHLLLLGCHKSSLPSHSLWLDVFSWGIHLTTVLMSTHSFCLQLLLSTFSTYFWLPKLGQRTGTTSEVSEGAEPPPGPPPAASPDLCHSRGQRAQISSGFWWLLII